jgi:hypothetical protein
MVLFRFILNFIRSISRDEKVPLGRWGLQRWEINKHIQKYYD